jgi:hypothetical protein
MSAINVNSITGRTGTHGPVLTGVTTATNGLNITGGSVGIGTDSPSRALEIKSSAPIIRLTEDTNTFSEISGNSSVLSFKADEGNGASTTRIDFRVDGSERMRIDSSGRLLVGTDTARTAGDVTAQLQVEGTSFATSSLNLISNAGASAGNVSHITLAKSRGSADGSNTIVANGDNLGNIQFAGADGTNINSTAALINAAVDGTPGTNDMPGRLMFHTTADGASAPTERLRITSGGEVKITNSGSSNGSTVQQLSLYTDNSGNGDNFTQRIAYTRANDNSKVFAAIDSVRTGTFNTDLVFSTDDGGVLGEKLRLISTGNVSITNGDLVVASGHGIDFSATSDGSGTNTSEVLDDYETGNWTPVLKSSTNVITVTGTQNYYRYIKVGRLVTLFYCINNATTSGTTGGACTVAGLPFTPSASTQNNRFMSGDVMFYNTGFKLDAWPVYPHTAVGDLYINFYEKASAGAPYGSSNVNTVGSGSYFFFTFTYYTD